MTRTMFDTTNIPADVIPADAEIVAGYVNGLYPSFAAVTARCPNAVHVSIAVSTAADADVLDIEKGDATPADAPGWTARQHARGNPKPSLYCEMSQAAEVISHMLAAGFTQHVDYELWVAAYDGRLTPTGYGEAAKQYINHGPHGENYDMSIVFLDGWPHFTQPVTRTWTFEEETMSYPRPVPADGKAHSIPVVPPHDGACQGGYGNVWFGGSWDDLTTSINATIKVRIIGIGFDESTFAVFGDGKAVIDAPKTRVAAALPKGTASVSVTIEDDWAKQNGIEWVPLVEAEVKGVPAT